MLTIKKINFFAILLVCLPTILFSSQETTRPLELPAFIIEGVEQHNIRSSIKQMPRKTTPLTQHELDSLNTFEKQQPTLLPIEKLPAHYIQTTYTEGFLKASYGLFNSPEFAAGYRFFADRFDIFATVGFAFSDGDALFSNNNKLFLDLRSNYIADEKFFIFGGSNTHTNLFLNTQNFNFYGYGVNPLSTKEIYPDKDYYDRTLTQAKFEVESEGNYDNFLFSVGGKANYISASHNTTALHLLTDNISNYYARGFLNVKNYWRNFLVGGNININLENANGFNQNYFQVDGSASYFDNSISILLKGGFQAANSSAQTYRGGVLLFGNVEYRMSKLFTIKANIFSGLEKTEFEHVILTNPYLSNRLEIDHRYDIANIKGSLWFHPNEKILLSAGANWRYSDRNPNFVLDTLAEFKLNYINGLVFDIFGELLWNITSVDRLIGKINFNITDPSDDNLFTYTPLLRVSMTYHRTLFKELRGFLTGEFISSQETSTTAATNNTLDSYFLLNFGVDWTFRPFNIFLKLHNITNSNYVVWDSYRERGLFGCLGLVFMF